VYAQGLESQSLKLQSSESGHMSTFTVIFFVAGVSDCCDLSRMTSDWRHFGHKSFVRPAHTGFRGPSSEVKN
jgi:hypothetical protein